MTPIHFNLRRCRWAGLTASRASLFVLLAACATPSAPLVFKQPLVLLGEVHDNAVQHALRLRAFEAWLAQGARPALLLEQIDRERQAAIDAVRAREPALDGQTQAQALIDAATPPPSAAGRPGGGWNWAFYKPFIVLALQHGLPIVAANVSRDDARLVMRQGLAAHGFAPQVPADVERPIVATIQSSHCGQIDEPTARRMALAQVARDQFMARTIEQHASRGVLLLAGNGHVRKDFGVPRWLSPASRARSQAIGLLEGEVDANSAGAYDLVLRTVTQSRPDPCGKS